MGAGAGLGWLIGAMITAIKSKQLQTAGVTLAVSELFDIGRLRQEAVRISPLSDPEALEEAARAIHWMMGVSDGDVIGPRDIRNWNYFHYNPRKGQAWWTRAYTSKSGKRRSFGRGARRGYGRGMSAARNIRSLSR